MPNYYPTQADRALISDHARQPANTEVGAGEAQPLARAPEFPSTGGLGLLQIP